MKKLAMAVAVFGSLLASAANAKTFVGVLWPMGGPLPAIGLVELVSEIKKMPDVEVKTYLHQQWPSLVEDIDRQPAGTRTVVVGYSLGANSSVFVANKAKYVDLIVALQPSVFSWNPPVRGKVGRMIEIYNPNPLMTFGGMGSKKLEGGNIEYIANNDSHPGAQFSSQFRNLVKGEIAKFTAGDRVEIAQANAPKPIRLAQLQPVSALSYAEEQPARPRSDVAVKAQPAIPEAKAPRPTKSAKPAADIAQNQPQQQPQQAMAFLDKLSGSVHSGDLFSERLLTVDAMKRYAERTYHGSPTAKLVRTASD